jgi:hypothetical protein
MTGSGTALACRPQFIAGWPVSAAAMAGIHRSADEEALHRCSGTVPGLEQWSTRTNPASMRNWTLPIVDFAPPALPAAPNPAIGSKRDLPLEAALAQPAWRRVPRQDQFLLLGTGRYATGPRRAHDSAITELHRHVNPKLRDCGYAGRDSTSTCVVPQKRTAVEPQMRG